MVTVTVGKGKSGKIDLCYEDHGSGQPVVLRGVVNFLGEAAEKRAAWHAFRPLPSGFLLIDTLLFRDYHFGADETDRSYPSGNPE